MGLVSVDSSYLSLLVKAEASVLIVGMSRR
jgi:hypothetical protein